jgi:hypothetical protein
MAAGRDGTGPPDSDQKTAMFADHRGQEYAGAELLHGDSREA